MHDAFTIGIPVLVIMFGILLNQRGIDRLESRLDRMQADLSQFYRDLGDHGASIDVVEKKLSR